MRALAWHGRLDPKAITILLRKNTNALRPSSSICKSQSPGRADIYVELAKLLDSEGKVTEAIDVLEQGMEKVSKKGPLLFYLARYYYSLGDTDKAAALTARAEASGMKMDSLRRMLDARSAADESRSSPDKNAQATSIPQAATARMD